MHIQMLFKKLKLLKVDIVFQLEELKYYYKYMYKNNTLPYYLQALHTISPTHIYKNSWS